MLYVALFTNHPGRDQIRQQFLADHLAYAEAHHQIKLVGSTRPEGEDISDGAVWILDTPDAQTARALCEADPFFVNGLRASVTIKSYRPAPEFAHLFG